METSATYRPVGPDRVSLAHEAMVSTESITRVYRGFGSRHMRARVTRAARVLGLPLPLEPKTQRAA